jgi:hypothetical protein
LFFHFQPSLWTNTMNRCLPLPVARLLTTLAILLVWTSSVHLSPAAAQTAPRQFPPAAKRGTLQVTQPPIVLINGRPERLSPGARIKGETNMMVMSASLVGTRVLVNYKRDAQGLIHEVWILSAQEALEKRDGMGTVTNIVFDSVASPKTDDGKTPFNQLPKYSGQ